MRRGRLKGEGRPKEELVNEKTLKTLVEMKGCVDRRTGAHKLELTFKKLAQNRRKSDTKYASKDVRRIKI